MPENATYVGRPSPWGNPFPVDGEYALRWAIATGRHGNAAGRRAAAVAGFRWYAEGAALGGIPFVTREPGGELEYSDGSRRTFANLVDGMGAMMLSTLPPLTLPDFPDLAPLRGRDLACWCPIGQPCHADVLIELANKPMEGD